MYLEITELKRGTLRAQSGKNHTGLNVVGLKVEEDGSPGEEWKKFLMDWANADEIQALEDAGVGARVNVKMKKNGKFWNVAGVELIEEAPDGPKTSTGKPQQSAREPRQENPTPNLPVDTTKTNVNQVAVIPDTKALALSKALELMQIKVKKGLELGRQ